MTSTSPAVPRVAPRIGQRFLLWIGLVGAEMAIASALFEFKAPIPDHQNPLFYLPRAARWFVLSIPVFLLLIGPGRHVLIRKWQELQREHDFLRGVAVNLAVFLVFAAACAAFTAHAASAATPAWHWLPAPVALLAATALSLLGVMAPLGGLAALAWSWRRDLCKAAAVSLVLVALVEAAPQLWSNLAGATLLLSATLMRIYEPAVVVDVVARTISVGEFTAWINDACSGSEGLVLVTGFLTLYLWLLRSELRFPAALLLYPIGFGASFLFNAIRISALTSIGGHYSEELASQGFHSQAGWIAFLLVTFGLMWLSLGLFQRHPSSTLQRSARSQRYTETSTHLLPFVALMLGSMAMAVSAPLDRPVYIVKAGAVAAALWAVRHAYAIWWPHISSLSVAAGLAVGAAWIATDPGQANASGLGTWLAEIGPLLALFWLSIRAVGTIVLVPIAEELAFRGYIYRRMISRDFFAVSPAAFSWVALLASSLLFGALHERWLAAALSGIAFALVMLRAGRLGAAVTAHAVANALIFIWALAFRQWSLL